MCHSKFEWPFFIQIGVSPSVPFLFEYELFTFIAFFLAEIPENEYIKYFSPEFSLRIPNGHIVCI
jgi:hypothetical protein